MADEVLEGLPAEADSRAAEGKAPEAKQASERRQNQVPAAAGSGRADRPLEAREARPDDYESWQEEAAHQEPSLQRNEPQGQASREEATPEKPAEASPADDKSPKHNALVLDHARQLGFSDEEIKESSPAELERAVRATLRRDEQWRKHLEANKPAEKKDDEKKPAEAAHASEDADWGVDEDGKPVDPNDFAPGIRNVVRSIKQRADEKVSALEKKVSQMEARAAADAYDRAFESLGDDFKGVFGEGAGRAMQSEAPEFQRRCIVLTHAGIDPQNDPPNVVRQKLKDAAERIFGPAKSNKPSKAREESRQEQENQTNRFANAGLARPSSRRPSGEPAGKQRAIENLSGAMTAQGLYVEDRTHDGEQLEEFPK